MTRPSLYRCVEKGGLAEFGTGNGRGQQRGRGDGFVERYAHVNRYAFVLVLDRFERVFGDDHHQLGEDGQKVVDGRNARDGADVSREISKRAFLNHEESAGKESSVRPASSDTTTRT